MPQTDWLSRALAIITIQGRAILEDPASGSAKELSGGDIVLLPHGSAHVLHDGSGQAPVSARKRPGPGAWMVSENGGSGERLDMWCERPRMPWAPDPLRAAWRISPI